LLAPFGFYGWGNIGDEATLQGFAKVVGSARQPFQVWVAAQNPKHTAKVEPTFRYFHSNARPWLRSWLRYRTSARVIAGGTPIMDCLGEWPLSDLVPLVDEARASGKPLAFVGSGTERLERDTSRRIVGELFAPIVRFWTVRSEPDEARLLEYGVPASRVSVAADMAWLLEPVSGDWGAEQLSAWDIPRGRLVGVNLMNERPVRERHPELFEVMGQWLDQLVESHDAWILFFCNDARNGVGFDRAAALRALSAMKRRDRTFLLPNTYWPPQRMMSLLANCYMNVSMRYHFCMFSALQGVPFVALQRSDKVVDLCGDLAWPYGLDLGGLDAEKLLELYETIDSRYEHSVQHLRSRIPDLRRRATRNIDALDMLIEP
jgi:polysaccharide pyruvyl transferase WcaK-like protein